MADAFTEQSSLQTGRRAVNDAPIHLLHVLAVGLLQRRLGLRDSSEASALIGKHFAGPDRQLRRVRAAGRLLRTGRRAGNRHTPIRPLAIDRDGRQAFNNALRTAVAVSLANGFWYVSDWPSGAAAVTWTALASMLLAARPNPIISSRNFLVGAALAAVVGVVVHYSILTTTGGFPLLAAALLPVCMLAALGRSDARAVSGGGYGIVVFNIVGPTNVMQYQFDATLNDVVATLLGLGLAVIAFSALPPPASASTRCWRARRRMAKGFRASVCTPDLLRPDTDRWLARMFDRLTQVGHDDGAIDGGQTLLLAGLLVLALRREDADLGRQVARNRAGERACRPVPPWGGWPTRWTARRSSTTEIVALSLLDRCGRAETLACASRGNTCGDPFARNRPARRVRQPGLDLFGRGIGHLAHFAASSG